MLGIPVSNLHLSAKAYPCSLSCFRKYSDAFAVWCTFDRKRIAIINDTVSLYIFRPDGIFTGLHCDHAKNGNYCAEGEK